jgi:hypothetical protein
MSFYWLGWLAMAAMAFCTVGAAFSVLSGG